MATSTKRHGMLVLAAASVIGLAGCSGSSGSGSSHGATDSGSTPMSSSANGGGDSTTTRSSPDSSTTSTTGSAAGNQQAVQDSSADLASTTFPVSQDRAMSVARKQMPGATMTKLALEFDEAKGRWVWRVDLQMGTAQRELKVDAGSGKIVRDERDHESGKPRAVDPKKLTPQTATKKATALVPGTVEEWALEFDDGTQRYKFDIRTHGSHTEDVIVDVATGKASRD